MADDAENQLEEVDPEFLRTVAGLVHRVERVAKDVSILAEQARPTGLIGSDRLEMREERRDPKLTRRDKVVMGIEPRWSRAVGELNEASKSLLN